MINLIRKKSNALVIGPCGLGDQIWMSGAVRYIAKYYKETHLFCVSTSLATLQTLYKDTPSIKFIVIVRVDDELRIKLASLYSKSNTYTCVFTKDLRGKYIFDMNDLPGVFYDQLGIPRSIRHSHFSLPRLSESIELFKMIESQPYIFVHTTSSETVTPIISWDISKMLTIDPNVNQYSSDHEWYGIAEKFVNQPFLFYVDVIKHATELHLVNSSFYTLASQIAPLDAKVKLCYDRYSKQVISKYNFS
jgi:hypothetical protein